MPCCGSIHKQVEQKKKTKADVEDCPAGECSKTTKKVRLGSVTTVLAAAAAAAAAVKVCMIAYLGKL